MCATLKFRDFRNVKTLKVILWPSLGWACANLKCEWIAYFVFSFGAAAPTLNTPLAWAQLLLGVCNPKIAALW